MKKIAQYFAFLLGSILLFSSTAFSQISAAAPWMRFESDNGEFSIELPVNPSYFYDADGFTYNTLDGSSYHYSKMQLLNAASEKTVVSVEIYEISSPKNSLKALFESLGPDDDKKPVGDKADESQKGFFIKTFEQKKIKDSVNDKDVEVSHITKFIVSKRNLYIITAANRGPKTPAFEHFFASVILNSAASINRISVAPALKISSLKLIGLDDIGEDITNRPDPPKATQPPNSLLPPIKDSAPVLILTKPQPSYTNPARQKSIVGTIRIRVILAKNGAIQKLSLVKSLPEGLNRNAVFAALRLKFIPREENNLLDTVTKTLEYSFEIY